MHRLFVLLTRRFTDCLKLFKIYCTQQKKLKSQALLILTDALPHLPSAGEKGGRVLGRCIGKQVLGAGQSHPLSVWGTYAVHPDLQPLTGDQAGTFMH